MASLNLPAAIEVTEGNTLPPSILEKAAAVRSLGGLEQLEQMLTELPELFKRNKDILDEVGKKIKIDSIVASFGNTIRFFYFVSLMLLFI